MAREKRYKLYFSVIRSDKLFIYLASSEKGAVSIHLCLGNEIDGATFFRMAFPSAEMIKDKKMNHPLLQAVEAALNGLPERHQVSMDIQATSFQWKVWRAIARIPFGSVKTYGEVANMVGKHGGARAIGQAMRRNPLPLLFP